MRPVCWFRIISESMKGMISNTWYWLRRFLEQWLTRMDEAHENKHRASDKTRYRQYRVLFEYSFQHLQHCWWPGTTSLLRLYRKPPGWLQRAACQMMTLANVHHQRGMSYDSRMSPFMLCNEQVTCILQALFSSIEQEYQRSIKLEIRSLWKYSYRF